MTYAEFERHAERVWDEIPDGYRSGVDGLVLRQEPKPHPTLPEIYTLGECLTESYLSDWGSPETTRSVLVLYYGSFTRLSALDPEFDWEYEVWETITHELRHHLESLAAEDALEDVDYAVDENFKRLDGQPFDPFFFRSGEPLGPDVYEVERDVFVEVALPSPRDGAEAAIRFRWGGLPYVVPAPAAPGDVTFIDIIDGIDAGDAHLCVVLVREAGALASLWRWLRRRSVDVVQMEAAARPVSAR